MKVLHIVSNISVRSGVMSVLMNYYRNINFNNIIFEFLYFDDREVTYRTEIELLGGRVHKIERSNNPIRFANKFRQFLKEHFGQYPIVHIHEVYLTGLLTGIKSKARIEKIIVHAHSTKFSDHKLANIRNQILSWPNRFLADYYFACSHDAGTTIFGQKFNKVGYIINNAIDLKKFCPNQKSRIEVRKELGLQGKFVIGHIGNFTPQKNHFFLINIFYEVQKINKAAVLVLVGDGKYRNKILNKCKELNIDNRVVYLGTRNDINRIMNSFDCFLLPSIYEGLGVVLIEAQATGIPCVYSNVVPTEANIFYEYNLTLSLNDTLEKWAKAVLYCSEQRKIVGIAEKISHAGYNIKTEAKKLEQIYIQIMG